MATVRMAIADLENVLNIFRVAFYVACKIERIKITVDFFLIFIPFSVLCIAFFDVEFKSAAHHHHFRLLLSADTRNLIYMSKQ